LEITQYTQEETSWQGTEATTGATEHPYEKSYQQEKGHEKQSKDNDGYKDARQISNTKVKQLLSPSNGGCQDRKSSHHPTYNAWLEKAPSESFGVSEGDIVVASDSTGASVGDSVGSIMTSQGGDEEMTKKKVRRLSHREVATLSYIA
jgi:hypothetical protein